MYTYNLCVISYIPCAIYITIYDVQHISDITYNLYTHTHTHISITTEGREVYEGKRHRCGAGIEGRQRLIAPLTPFLSLKLQGLARRVTRQR